MAQRSSRFVLTLALSAVVASLSFALGTYSAQRMTADQVAISQARVAALQEQVDRTLATMREAQTLQATGTSGRSAVRPGDRAVVNEIKREIQAEMGLMSVQIVKERRRSFVELYTYDNRGSSNYGTAGYLGAGHFITVKHGVISMDPLKNDKRDRHVSEATGSGDRDARRIVSVKLAYAGGLLDATLVDAGDARAEVDAGDWAILRVNEAIDLPPLRIDLSYAFEFADPLLRLGNDYSKGVLAATGYVGQRTPNGLVTCLTDGHPGVSGGGVLNQQGDLVGIPVGRMQGDFRFSFILPLRREMFRNVSQLLETVPVVPATP